MSAEQNYNWLFKVVFEGRWRYYIPIALILGTITFMFKSGRIYEVATARINDYPALATRVGVLETKMLKLENMGDDIKDIKKNQDAILLKLAEASISSRRGK